MQIVSQRGHCYAGFMAIAGPAVGYAASGKRRYGDEPNPIRCRHLWEIQLVNGVTAEPRFILGEERRGRWMAGSVAHPWKLWIFSPRSAHGWQDVQGRHCNVTVLHLSEVPRAMERLFDTDLWVAWGWGEADHSALHSALEYRDLIQRIASDEALRNPSYQETLAAQAVWLITRLIMPEIPGPTGDFVPNLTERMVAVYEAHMHQSLTQAQLARHLGTSRSTLVRAVQRETNKPLGTVLEERLFARARWLLEHTTLSIREIASGCGFRDHGAFSRAFRRETGKTPRGYRAESHHKT